MYRKPPGNPKIAELSKSYKERSFNLANLKVIKISTGEHTKPERFCAWCATEKLTHGNQKYCSNNCSTSAMAWAYPQKEDSLGMLLIAQEWKCKLCQFDYLPIMQGIISREWHFYKGALNDLPWHYFKRLKGACLKKNKPEVDHIEPIYKGGQTIGLENHQAICYTCHKAKTSTDLSGKRAKKV